MCSCVESTKSVSAFDINLALNNLSDSIFIDLLIKIMQETFTYLLNLVYLVLTIPEGKCT